MGTELIDGLVGVANRVSLLHSQIIIMSLQLVAAAVFKGYSGENMRPAGKM